MRPLIVLVLLAVGSTSLGADIPFDPVEWRATKYIDVPRNPNNPFDHGWVTYSSSRVPGGEVAATLAQQIAFPWTIADRDDLVVDSLYVLGNVDALWLATYDQETLTVSRAAAASRADGDHDWSRFDITNLGLSLDSVWFTEPLAVLLGPGYITSFGYSTWSESAWPLGVEPASFSGGHLFSETDFDPVGARLVLKSSEPEPGSGIPTRLFPPGLLSPAGEFAFSYNYKIAPEPSTSLLFAIGGLVLACQACSSRWREPGPRRFSAPARPSSVKSVLRQQYSTTTERLGEVEVLDHRLLRIDFNPSRAAVEQPRKL